MDAARAQLQGWRLRPPGAERDGDGEGRPALCRAVPLADAILRRTAHDGRPGLRGRVRALPLPRGLRRGERAAEVGPGGGHGAVRAAVVGQEHDVADGPLHRLRADVRQVPRRVVHPGPGARVAAPPLEGHRRLPRAHRGRGPVDGCPRRHAVALGLRVHTGAGDAAKRCGQRLPACRRAALHPGQRVRDACRPGAERRPALLPHHCRRRAATLALCPGTAAPVVHRGRHCPAVPRRPVGRQQALPV